MMRMLLSGHGMVRLLPVLLMTLSLLWATLPHGAAAMPANATGIAPATPAQYAFLRLFQRSEPEPVPAQQSRTRPARPAAPAPLRTDPDAEEAASTRIAVFGDSLATNLGQGLQALMEEEEGAEIAVSVQARGSSGLVRDDFFDWPANLARILADAPDFDIAVLQIGLNDRQALRVDGASAAPLSDPWRAEYGQRIDVIAQAFADAGIPLIWVGLPPMQSSRLSTDLAMINEIVRDRLRRSDVIHVDIWKGFVDENDRYSATGPDLSGQPARLRTSDGIHLTKAGAGKAAHFVDIEIQRLITRPRDEIAVARAAIEAADDATARIAAIDMLIRRSLGELPLAPGLLYTARRDPVGPVMPLTRIDVSAQGILLSGNPPLDPATRIITERVLEEGVSPPPVAGRADDFRWPRSP
ncbi:SGNH/GDSL hydrolase family protein [Saliniramus fredricksonii]|nr:SGNH family hydrolase [Saliniramus fredricksonii]